MKTKKRKIIHTESNYAKAVIGLDNGDEFFSCHACSYLWKNYSNFIDWNYRVLSEAEYDALMDCPFTILKRKKVKI